MDVVVGGGGASRAVVATAVATVAAVAAIGLDETRVLVSRDGVRWSDTPLREIVGDRPIRGIARIVVTADRTVITVATGECGGGCEGPTEQVAAIGVST